MASFFFSQKLYGNSIKFDGAQFETPSKYSHLKEQIWRQYHVLKHVQLAEDVDLYLFYMECANNTHKSDAKYHGNATENTNTSLKRMDNNGEYGVSDDVCAQNRSKCIANTIRFSATPRTALCIEYPTATPTIALCIEYFDFWTAADGVGCDSVIEQLQQCLHRIEECKDPSPTQSD
eukprot:123153_1